MIVASLCIGYIVCVIEMQSIQSCIHFSSSRLTVESNDTLYGHDVKFLREIEKISSTIVEEILSYLKSLSDGYEVRYGSRSFSPLILIL